MAKAFEFPDATQCTPKHPLVMVAALSMVRLFNRTMVTARRRNKTTIDYEVQEWLDKTAPIYGWAEVVVFGEQVVFNSGLATGEKKRQLASLIRNRELSSLTSA